jgi:hypothetical protein
MSNFLELYEPLDIIGNGSFGIIRKVRRKSDGQVSPQLGPFLHPEDLTCLLIDACTKGAQLREDE